VAVRRLLAVVLATGMFLAPGMFLALGPTARASQASHDGVRVPMWTATYLYSRIPMGTVVRIYSS
jgi:hypothetical protein